MKLSKRLPFYISLTVIVVLVLTVTQILLQKKKELLPSTPKLAYSLKPSKTDLKPGEKLSVPLYLTEEDANQVVAYDIKIDYDKTKLKLTNAFPGGFLKEYMTIKWDLDEGWFAVALSPTKNPVNPAPTLPLLTLEFTALEKSDSTSISTGATTVYVSNVGGFRPLTGTSQVIIR